MALVPRTIRFDPDWLAFAEIEAAAKGLSLSQYVTGATAARAAFDHALRAPGSHAALGELYAAADRVVARGDYPLARRAE